MQCATCALLFFCLVDGVGLKDYYCTVQNLRDLAKDKVVGCRDKLNGVGGS